MYNSKNKNLAALLAFFGGIVGLQRFYLGQKGLGFLMIFLAIISIGVISSIIGIIDSILFLSMSDEEFDYKYNTQNEISRSRFSPRYKSYERRYKTRQSRQYTGVNETTNRRDRRMDKREFRVRKKEQVSKTSGPYRRPKTRRSSGKERRRIKEAQNLINKYKESGIEKFKDYDIEESIIDFNQILKIDPNNIAAHFNLACAYSQLEKPEKSMHHISMAVKAGFDDFEKIHKHEKLAFTRIQLEWEDFAKNGFIFDTNKEGDNFKEEVVDSINENPAETQKEDLNSEKTESVNLLQHLKTLKEQREKGIITETEFEIERRKLMSS